MSMVDNNTTTVSFYFQLTAPGHKISRMRRTQTPICAMMLRVYMQVEIDFDCLFMRRFFVQSRIG